jgi:dihydrofolate reductase
MAARVQYFAAMSLDGYIAESDDTIDWLTKYDGSYDGPDADDAAHGGYEEFYEGVGANVMGSATYQFLLDEASTWHYKGKPTWVLSSRDLPRHEDADEELRIVNAAVTDLYEEMAAAAGDRNLWVIGGGNVASQFADAGLLHELIVTVVPVVLGQGKPLFDRRLPGGAMQLAGARPFRSGMVQLRYELAR